MTLALGGQDVLRAQGLAALASLARRSSKWRGRGLPSRGSRSRGRATWRLPCQQSSQLPPSPSQARLPRLLPSLRPPSPALARGAPLPAPAAPPPPPPPAQEAQSAACRGESQRSQEGAAGAAAKVTTLPGRSGASAGGESLLKRAGSPSGNPLGKPPAARACRALAEGGKAAAKLALASARGQRKVTPQPLGLPAAGAKLGSAGAAGSASSLGWPRRSRRQSLARLLRHGQQAAGGGSQ